jgi:ATP-binding cassette, subfamily B (MDR/TAP), member 1
VRNGSYSDLQFFIVIPALLFSAQAAGQMFSLAPEVTKARSAAQSVFELHDQKPSIVDVLTLESIESRKLPPQPHSSKVSPKGTCIRVKEVHYTYPARPEAPVLANVNLTVEPGELVAFVGRSGAGKSSVIALLERFFDPTIGNVYFNGEDIRNIPIGEHRARISLVEQDPELFPGSIKYNISLGARPGHQVALEKVIEVCQQIGFHEFVMTLPEGYNTECGNSGSKLSGGQRQRIAIARALIRNPEILLLDEATSQLDSCTEQEVKKAIMAASSGRTTIMVAHRLASVQNADRIYVFEGGKIIEAGRHDELVASGGDYASMVAAQELT